jgi:hypothetical protein
MLPMVWQSLSVPDLGLPRHGKMPIDMENVPQNIVNVYVHSKCHSGYNTSLHAHVICILGHAKIPTCQGKCPPWYGKSTHDHGKCSRDMLKCSLDMVIVTHVMVK